MKIMHLITTHVPAIKIRFFIRIVIIFTVYLFLYYIILETRFNSKSRPLMTPLSLPFVVVHLDLKGAPPKLEYLVKFFELIKKHGANALLIEYEDMFPYEGRLVNLSAKHCYNKAQLKQVLTSAAYSGLEIIPLVQTFGHLEYVLKLSEFRHLREDPMYPDSICPSKSESLDLISDMLKQVISFHLSIAPLKYIHVGCDEVYQLNKCPQCTERNISNLNMFLKHLNIVRDVVTLISEETTVLIWDDMLRSVSLPIWNNLDNNYFHKIEPVYWDYQSDLRVTHINLMKYHKKFANIWVASAFKGADGNTAVIPDLGKRYANHHSWLNLIRDYKFGGETNTFIFKGIMLTGWSRYNHMEPICELLPVAIPSLILNLLQIKKYKDWFPEKVNTHILNIKKCHECTGLNNLTNDLDNINCSFCDFEGNELINILQQYMLATNKINNTLNYILDRSAEYDKSPSNNNTYAASQRLLWCNDSFKQIIDLENNIAKAMAKYYDKHIIAEYIAFKTLNLKNNLYNLISILQKQFFVAK